MLASLALPQLDRTRKPGGNSGGRSSLVFASPPSASYCRFIGNSLFDCGHL
jgi:hypothetical protein